jgi:Zn-finger nucleic acid-binding protein
VALDTEDFDGTATMCCPSCRGTFFPDRSLEAVLNKLRATCDPMDPDSVLREFKDRFRRELPDAVRYKACPVCDTIMTRRNYGSVSGVVVDECPDHGTWVDSNAFAALADFICRGGDVLSRKADSLRQRATTAKRKGGGLMDRFLGNKD